MRSQPGALCPFFALLLIAIASPPALAAWPNQPSINVPICRAANYQSAPQIVADGTGGAIITWMDYRNATNYHIYAQHVLASGIVDPAWPTDGQAICTAANDQFSPLIVSDGAGGAIVGWTDHRNGVDFDIYVQHVLASGVVDAAWPVNGRALCTAANDQNLSGLISDGSGGAIATWGDYRAGNSDIYARRVSAGGTALWTADGVPICTAVTDQYNPSICPDGAGGAIIAWSDFRNGLNDNIFAQHVLAAGTVDGAWAVNGVQVTNLSTNQLGVVTATDGAGGVWLAYTSPGSGGWYDVYVNHVNAGGYVVLSTGGRSMCTAQQQQDKLKIVPDAAGGAVVAWEDYRTFGWDIYAGHLTGGMVDGTWPTDGLGVCTDPYDQQTPSIVADGAGGAIVTWKDQRGPYGNNIFAQHVLPSGYNDYVWPYNGRAVCLTGIVGIGFPVAATDGAGGAIIAWEDYRDETYTSNIYAQRIESFGRLGNPEAVILSAKDVPNDQGGHLKLSWNASYLDAAPYNEIKQYEVWRSIPPAAAEARMKAGAPIASVGERSSLVPGRSLRTTGFGAQVIAWEYVGAEPAHRLAAYSYDVPTTSDSIGAGNPLTQLMVIADDNDNYSFWMSASAAGYSVDNLPPVAPAPFTAAYLAGATHLHWGENSEADLAGYRLYRGSSSGFVPGPGNLIAAKPDTGFADTGPAGSWYKLSAIDIHGNESLFALLGPNGTLDAGSTFPSVVVFQKPRPNPATGPTTLNYVLPHEAHVLFAVYDAVGRRVRTFADGTQPLGEHWFTWDLRDDTGHALGAGLYFATLDVEGHRITRRIATLK